MLTKFSSDKINVAKISLFFLPRAPTLHSVTFNCISYLSWSTSFMSLKLCVRFSIFESVSFLINFLFLLNKMRWLFDVIIHFKNEMIKKPPTGLLPDVWFLSWTKKFESSMISMWVGALQKLTWRQAF